MIVLETERLLLRYFTPDDAALILRLLNDRHIAVWLPAPIGIQEMLIASSPEKFFKPPYVGGRGWIGVELNSVSDEELDFHLRQA